MDQPSICIPRMFNTISREKIRSVFEALRLGVISHIDLHLGREFQRVFIYITEWHSNPFATLVKERILAGEELKIIYDDPWFWKCRLNRSSVANPPNLPRAYVSRYNTGNQLLAMKATLKSVRADHERVIADKDKEIKRLQAMLSSCTGDEALLKRKRSQQKNAQEHRVLTAPKNPPLIPDNTHTKEERIS